VYATQADTGAEVVEPDAEPLRAWRAGLKAPTRLSLGADGTVYVADPNGGQIVARAPDGRVLWRRTGLGRPLGVAEDGAGNLLVADGATGAITAWDVDWTARYQLGAGAGETLQPADVAVGADGLIYVVDSFADQVRMYEAGGAFLRTFGEELDFPVALDIDPNTGNVLVLDQRNRRIQVYTPDGTWGSAFGEYGDEDYQLQSPQGIHVDDAGRVWVADAVRGEVFVYDRVGDALETVGEFGEALGQLRQPADLLLDGEGRLLVASANNGRIEIFHVDEAEDPEAYAPAFATIDTAEVQPGVTFRVRVEIPGHRLSTVTGVAANGVAATTTSEADSDGDGEPELLVEIDGTALAEATEDTLIVTGALTDLQFTTEALAVTVVEPEPVDTGGPDDTDPTDTDDTDDTDVAGDTGAPVGPGAEDGEACGCTGGAAWLLLPAGLLALRRRSA
jgi:DNA-binding beta-propeller fold protein YncE